MVVPSPPKMRRYFSRRVSRLPELLKPHDFVGYWSPLAVFWGLIFLTVPFSYLYIVGVLLRELCRNVDCVRVWLEVYLPPLAALIARLHQSSRFVEVWCCIEAVFYIGLKLHINWLQRKDPLEASLSAAPIMSLEERQALWRFMMECESADPITFLSGWFFDVPIDKISKYDLRDFVVWSMFEGRHQEHLTEAELEQLEAFVEETEYRIGLHLYGPADDDGGNDDDNQLSLTKEEALVKSEPEWKKGLAKPKKVFRFSEEITQNENNFFSELYESYKNRYEQLTGGKDFHPVQDLKDMMNEFHPVQDFKNLMAETRQHIAEAEESAMATALQMSQQMYTTLVPSGSSMDKQLTAMSHATYAQLTEAWNSVKNMRERLETARFLSKQRQRIRQQLRGYRVMLDRMREMSAVETQQLATMMRRITECNQALELLEKRAATAFEQATGFARKNLPFLSTQEPHHYARYSSDPLLGLATYPLGFHLLVLGLTEIPLRILMKRRGFERRTIGRTAYYVHPGRASSLYADDSDDDETNDKTPIVFIHGIGIGLIVYLPLIDKLLATGRPILLPEIPYVSGFRPFQSPNGVLSPAQVASTMTAMLASHGFLRATWVGHSYGTTWLSYMIKHASHAVAAVVFLDPICFCLHVPFLTKQFVYMKPDPGTVSYMVRTDVIVNWTIQRSFPWARVILFEEQISVPCSIFLSEHDQLVPAGKVEAYLRTKSVPMADFDCVDEAHFCNRMSCTIFRGVGHGDWTDHPTGTVPKIATAIELLCQQVEDVKDSGDTHTS